MARLRVPVIEADEDIRQAAKRSLEAVGGHQAVLAASGQVGTALAKALKPDVIILDGMMPGLDGFDTLRLIRAEPKTAFIPVVLMTARVSPGKMADYQGEGVIGVVQKPFDPMTLAQSVEEYLRQHEIGKGS